MERLQQRKPPSSLQRWPPSLRLPRRLEYDEEELLEALVPEELAPHLELQQLVAALVDWVQLWQQ